MKFFIKLPVFAVFLALFSLPSYAIKLEVSANLLNIRQSPSVSSKIIGVLKKGDIVEAQKQCTNWDKISFGKICGYAYNEHLQNINNKSNDIIDFSKSLLKTPYKHGGTSQKGFDCSGFVQYVFKKFKVSLPRTASEQLKKGQFIAKNKLKPGDLVFFKNPSFPNKKAGHVGIYIGNNNFIHASSPGDVVKITSLNDKYYSKYYLSAKRVV